MEYCKEEGRRIIKMLLVICPHCKNKIELVFENLFWTDDEKAFYKCQSCGREITDADRFNMLLNMDCEQLKELKFPVSILFNALYSPFVSFAEIVQEFKRDRTDNNKFESFAKYWLGKGLEEK